MKPKMRNLRLKKVKKFVEKFMRFVPEMKKVKIDGDVVPEEGRWVGQIMILGKLEDDEFDDGREMI